ncbi:MAG: VOC family protein [Gammaproteobacteria bacterium]|nr:VOC family protein [Gammaproteobacteria bacterium]MCW5583768.1 VOC family protein [Gammaproteobacteria bacterium]
MKFGYTIIYVSDVESTISFYQKAFKLEKSFLHESKQYGELNTGDIKLAFASNSLAESNGIKFAKNDAKKEAAGFEIALITNDVKQGYNHALSNGAIAVKEPTVKPWGQEVAYVLDLNGIIVEICSPMG